MTAACDAAIFHDDQTQCIRVIDFPAHSPCTLARLLTMDKLYGWGKVSYEPNANTYTITSDLCIGGNDGTETHFQVGSAARPGETLVMKGRLIVHPYWIAGENPESTHWRAEPRTNRLTIGMRGETTTQAALKFDGKYGLMVGRAPRAKGKLVVGHGGQLYVHHGRITSARPDEPCGDRQVSMCLAGDRIVLDHATLSRMRGFMTYGMGRNAQVSHTVFEHGGSAIINGQHDLKGCTFRNCGVAIRDYGSLDAILTGCTFEGNEHNWTLTFTRHGLVCVDCTWDEPAKGDVYKSWVNRRTKVKQYPSFVSKRHIVVEVVDTEGRPVAGANVRVRSEQGASAMAENALQTTDKLGRTHSRGSADAILLAELTKRSTDIDNQPETDVCSYTIEAQADGTARAVIKGFRPTTSWQVVRLALKPN